MWLRPLLFWGHGVQPINKIKNSSLTILIITLIVIQLAIFPPIDFQDFFNKNRITKVSLIILQLIRNPNVIFVANFGILSLIVDIGMVMTLNLSFLVIHLSFSIHK